MSETAAAAAQPSPGTRSTTRPAGGAWSRSAPGSWVPRLLSSSCNCWGSTSAGGCPISGIRSRRVPPGYIVAALILQSGQTLFAGLSYYGILRAAYPGEGQVYSGRSWTAYAVGVAMNNFLPANIGTFVTLMMFTAIIPACTFPGAIAAYLVQKIFFTVAGTFVYLYLFLSVPGSFNENLGNLSEHPGASILIAAGAVFLIVILGRIFWKQLKKLWARRSRAARSSPGRGRI